jgi:hypothetical protein
MRTVLVDEASDLEGLKTRLVGSRTLSAANLEKIKRLNPHVDLERIPAGTVLLIPELPGLRARVSSPTAGDALTSLADSLLAAVDAARERVTRGFADLEAEGHEVTAAMRSPAFRRALDADPELRAQVEAAAEVSRRDRERASAVEEILGALKDEAHGELDAVAKLLG